MLRLLICCIWLLAFMVLALADRSGDLDTGSLDVIGLLKIASRMAVFATVLFVLWSSRHELLQRYSELQWLPWWLYAAWAVASLAWSALPSVSLGQSASLVLLLMLACGLSLHGRSSVRVSQVLLHLCLAMLLISSVVLVARLVSPDTMSMTRAGKGVFHATNAAATGGLGVIIAVGARLFFGWKWTRWLLTPSLLVHGAAVVLASNRASLSITMVVVVGMVLFGAPAVWRWLLITVFSVALGAYLAIDPGLHLSGGLGDRIATYVARDQSAQELAALSGREEMWTVVWNSYLRSPWIGHGYFVSSASGQLKVWYTWTNWTAHNFWLQVLVGTGIVGAALLAWGLGSYVLQLLRARSLQRGSRRIALFAGTVLLWQCGWGLTNESFAGPLQTESIAFFTVLGLTMARLGRPLADHDLRTKTTFATNRQTLIWQGAT